MRARQAAKGGERVGAILVVLGWLGGIFGGRLLQMRVSGDKTRKKRLVGL